MSEMKSLTLNGKTYDSFVDKEARAKIENLNPGGSGTPGENGGYYTPKVEQTDANTMKVSYTASKEGMAAVADQNITLPAGPKGDKYELTDADKQEIAEQAAQLVEVPEGGSGVTDEQIAQAVEDYLAENPVEAGEENLYEFAELNTDIIGAMGNSALCGKRTINVVPSGNANVMNCGVMALHNSYNNILAYTEFDSGDVITNGRNTGTIYAVVQKTNDSNGGFELSVSEPIAIVKYGDKVLGIDGVTEYELNSGAVADTMFTVNGNTVLIFEAYARPAGSTAVAKRMVFATTFPKPASAFAAVDVSAYSQPKALSLLVDSENVDFDMTNLSSYYDSVVQHNGDSTVYNNIVYWVITNNYKGWIVLTSTDGYTWEFNDYVVPEKYAENLYLEAAVGFYQNYKVIAGRTNTDFMVIQMMAGNQKGKVITVKDCPYGSKPSIVIHDRIAYIGHNVKDRDSYELLAMPMRVDAEKENNIYRVCGWKGIASQYTVLKMAPSKQNYPNASGVTNYAYVISAFGMNGNQFLKKGCSFVFDAFDTSLVKLDAGGANMLQSTLVYTMLDKYKATLSGVVSTSGTLTFTGAVEGSYDGSEDISIKIPGAAWVNVANETLEAEATGFTEITLEKPRTISHIRVYAEIVGTATNTNEQPLWLEVNEKLVADTQSAVMKTDGSKKFVYIDADIVASGSFGKGYVQTNNGDTYTSPSCNRFMTDITTATEVNKILVRSKWGWSTLGVGSKLIVDIC